MSKDKKIYPWKPLRADLQGQPRRKRAPYDKILRDYSACALGEPKTDLAVFQDVTHRICPNGRLAPTLNGQSLQWHSGLSSLCRPEIEGQVGAAAKLHQEHTQRLFLKWRERDDRHEGRYDSPPEPESRRPARRGAHLCPGLPIPDREFLSEAYLSQVLRPYARAEYECRQIFWRHLQEGHKRGHWIGFMPTDTGIYVPMMPGTGFGTSGHYEIDRATYLHGFGIAESELGLESYPHSDPYPGQSTWMFVGAEQLADYMLVAESNSTEQEETANRVETSEERPVKVRPRGRPKGTGFEKLDAPFVEEGAQMLRDGVVNSARAAARELVAIHRDKTPNHGSDAAIKRLARKIRRALDE